MMDVSVDWKDDKPNIESSISENNSGKELQNMSSGNEENNDLNYCDKMISLSKEQNGTSENAEICQMKDVTEIETRFENEPIIDKQSCDSMAENVELKSCDIHTDSCTVKDFATESHADEQHVGSRSENTTQLLGGDCQQSTSIQPLNQNGSPCDDMINSGIDKETLPPQEEVKIHNIGCRKQFTELRNGENNKDMTSDSESDSDSSSSSSSSSDSEENRKTDKKIERNNLVEMIEDDDSDKVKKLNMNGLEDIRTKGELFPEELPPVENLLVSVDEDVELCPIGNISSIVGILVVIQSNKDIPPLHEETVLFHNRVALGQIFEVFGPVSTPWYSIRFNSLEEISNHDLKVGNLVYYAPKDTSFTNYVFVEDLKRVKGSDASWENNNEPPAKHLDYSDDEDEKRAKAKKRGKSEVTVKVEEEDGSLLPGARQFHKRQRHRNNRQREVKESVQTRHLVEDERTGKKPFGSAFNNNYQRSERNMNQTHVPHFGCNERPASYNFQHGSFASAPPRPWRNHCPLPNQNLSHWNGPPPRYSNFGPRLQNNTCSRMPMNFPPFQNSYRTCLEPSLNSNINFSNRSQYTPHNQSNVQDGSGSNIENNMHRSHTGNFYGSAPENNLIQQNQSLPCFQSPVVDTRLINNQEVHNHAVPSYNQHINSGYHHNRYASPFSSQGPQDNGPIHH